MPQCAHVGARSWIAHSNESNTKTLISSGRTSNVPAYSLPQAAQTPTSAGLLDERDQLFVAHHLARWVELGDAGRPGVRRLRPRLGVQPTSSGRVVRRQHRVAVVGAADALALGAKRSARDAPPRQRRAQSLVVFDRHG